MLKKGVTLRGIEVFETLAQTGSVAQTAITTGLSQPAVSQQMRNLEVAVGTELVDHAHRPMRPTPAGQIFLRRASKALTELRQAQSEVTVIDLEHLKELSLGIMADFGDDLTPRLVTILADSMTGCQFRMITKDSNTLVEMVKSKGLHMAITAQTGPLTDAVVTYPLLRDPFLIVAPAGMSSTPAELLTQEPPLPFLQNATDQLISEQIATHLDAANIKLRPRFEIGSHLALMALVARGIGWTITTPLGYLRAARFHEGMQARALPIPNATRQITLIAGADRTDAVPRDIAVTMRHLLQEHIISPALTSLPWLKNEFHILEDETP